ncbi:hypothetical protein, partial [Mycobacterium kansasii]|uniref:hypothetical protein n=1 Tax=Mycobacterium kansasii TaxID=1768 RepID=UPI001FE24FCA
MRVGVVGVAAAAMVGGTLAVAPLTMSGPMRTPNQGTCTAGQQCDRLASVLMPGTSAQPGKPAQAAPAPAQLPTDALTPVLAPRAAPEAARAVPGVASGPGLPGVTDLGPAALPAAPPLPDAALPAGPGLPDIGTPYIGTPYLGVPGLGLPGVPNLANGPAAVGTATSVVNGVLGIGGTIAGVTTSSALAVTYVVLAYNALQSSGILPQLNSTANTIGSMLFPSGLPSVGLPTLSLPGLPALSGVSPAGLIALAGVGGLPNLSLPSLPGVSPTNLLGLAAAGLPGLPGVSPTDVVALAAGGLPQLASALPGLQAGLPALPGVDPAMLAAALPALAAGLPGGLPAVDPAMLAAALPALTAGGLPALPGGLPALPGGLPALPGGLPALPVVLLTTLVFFNGN